MAHLRSLIYWNPDRMEELFEQIPASRRPKLRLEEAAVRVRFGVLSGAGKFRATPGTASPVWTFMLDAVVDELSEHSQLAALRPTTVNEYRTNPNARYVYEFTTATRVHLPISKTLRHRHAGLPKYLRVWVSDPPPRPSPPRDEFDYYGAYLYLIEEGDPAPFGEERTLEAMKLYQSGCSALHRLLEGARETDELGPEKAESNGRGSSEHPLVKLAGEGAHS